MRSLYGERREILHRALERYCSGALRIVGIGAGLRLAGYLQASLRASVLMDRTREAGVALDPIQRFAAVGARTDGVVFGYGAIDSMRIEEGVRKLAALLERR